MCQLHDQEHKRLPGPTGTRLNLKTPTSFLQVAVNQLQKMHTLNPTTAYSSAAKQEEPVSYRVWGMLSEEQRTVGPFILSWKYFCFQMPLLTQSPGDGPISIAY